MANLFTSVQLRRPKRNMIPLNYGSLLTTSFGRLTPCLCEEALPGDYFRVKTEIFTRFQPLIAPIMDKANVSLHYFFVPSRILFEDFYPFMTGEDDDAVIPWAYLHEIVNASVAVGAGYERSLMDYLNLPTHFAGLDKEFIPEIPINLLPFLSYHRIFWEYYRDENLMSSGIYDHMFQTLESARLNGGHIQGSDLEYIVQLWNRSYKKDYFTSALPWPQKGDDVLLPLQDSPVYANMPGNVAAGYVGDMGPVASTQDPEKAFSFLSHNGDQPTTLSADNRSLAPTINDLRKSFRIQELLERNARGGTRPQEFIRAHWGVNAKDARLQRPEYIGGSTTPIQISEVLSQSLGSGDDSQLGIMGGHGITAGVSGTKKYRVTEHGYIMGILSVMPHASYYQGVPRMYSHLDRYDFFFPSLANLGEQEIKNKEIYVEPGVTQAAANEKAERTFGYTPRYAEYKFHPDEIHGDFRNTLNYWHLARQFYNTPGLNSSFVEVDSGNSGIDRIFTYTQNDYDQILVQLYHHNKAVRLMPYFGNPKY